MTECIHAYKPHLVCITETKLDSEGDVDIQGYKFIPKNNKKGKGGILVGVREDLKHLILEIDRMTEGFEALWIILSNKVTKIRIGCIYAPQECRTGEEVFEAMYKHIQDHVVEARKKGEKVLITGDFNGKIGDVIEGNKDVVTKKSGKLLKELVSTQDLKILNSSPKCEGKWTRIEGETKSILDYIIVNANDEEALQSMKVDEEKLYTPYTVSGKRMIPSDHCAIMATFNWVMKRKDEEVEEYLFKTSQKNRDKFYRMTSETKLKMAIQGGSIQDKYSAWEKELDQIISKCFKTKKKRKDKRTPEVRKLMSRRRELLKELKTSTEDPKQLELRVECNELEEKIRTEKWKSVNNGIMEEIRKINEGGGIESGAFWEFKKRMEGKRNKESPTAIMGSDKVLKTTREEIRDEFESFYSKLFTQDPIIDPISRKLVDKRMQIIEQLAKESREQGNCGKITSKEVSDHVNRIKNKTTLDLQDTNNIMIKSGGKDLIESVTELFAEINQKQEQPNQWTEMMVNSIYKNKGDRKDLENRRGLFITNNLSKVYDKIKMTRNEDKLNKKISKFQCGGMKERQIADHTMTLDAVIGYNKSIGCETYILFADAYKCFDKLNLKDCICDISEIIGPTEAYELYNMNRKGTATIKTPVGKIPNITADNIVRQGTIPGPKLCAVNTDKINKIGKKCYTFIGPRIVIEMMIFMDDIQHPTTNVENIISAANNLQQFENTKGYTFSIEGTKTAILIVGKKKNKVYELDAYVNKGKIPLTNEYKYLGKWYNEQGNNKLAIEKKKAKTSYYIQKIKQYGNEFTIGKYAIVARIRIHKRIIVPTVYHNVEAWSNITKTDMEELEKIQKNIVQGMCEMRRSTPYLGLLAELGIWPVKHLIGYKQIMLLHNIITSKDGRLIKEIIEDQILHPWEGCWYEGVEETCREYEVKVEEIRTWSKYKCKREIRRKVEKKIQKEFEERKEEMTKLRFVENVERKKYIEELEYSESITLLRLRLNMIETKCNYKGNFVGNQKCHFCSSEDTTEHLLECPEFEWSREGIKNEELDIHNPGEILAKYVRRIIKLREEKGFQIKFGKDE